MAGNAVRSDSDPDVSDSDVDMEVESEGERAIDDDKLQELREAISANLLQYDSHVALIHALRSAERFEELRAAREAMHKVLPMSEDLWLAWLEDETRIAVSTEEKAALHTLWEEATKDFLSVNIWRAYASFALEEFAYRDETQSQSEAVETVREVLAKAISAVGYHIPKSREVWDMFRQFEEDLLEANRTDAQLSRVISLYNNRMNVPHAGIEETFSQLSSFVTNHDNANYEKHMVAAKKSFNVGFEKFEEREPYENAVADAQESYEAFFAYIEFEIAPKKPDVLAARTVFERALAVHFSVPDLWLEYISFMVKHLNISHTLTLCVRALRNCPWSGDLWSQYIRLLEKADSWNETVEEASQRGLEHTLIQGNLDELVKVWNAKIDYARWRFSDGAVSTEELRLLLQSAADSLKQFADPYHRIELRRINTELYVLGDIAQAHQLWKSLVQEYPTESELHVRRAEFKRQQGDAQKALSLLRSAAQRNLDWPERVFEVLISMERDHGTPESLHQSLNIVRHQQRRHATKASLQMQQAQYAQQAPNPAVAIVAAVATGNVRRQGGASAAHGNRRERRRQGHAEASCVAPGSVARGGIFMRDDGNGFKSENKRKSISWGEKIVIDVEDGRTSKRPKLPATRQKKDLSRTAFMLTVCVKNVDPLVTEKQIRDFFADVGVVHSIRFPPNATASEFCEVFVEFGNASEAFAALKKNNGKLGDRVVQVESGRDEGDMRTVYVSNFPEGYGEAELTELFKDFGTIEKVRLPSIGPHHRRFAYVQFADESAAQAACQLNGANLGDQWDLYVAISNPRMKKTRTAPPGRDPQALFFSNLKFSTSEQDLKELCEKHGQVENVRLLCRSDGKPRGLAIVRFSDAAAAAATLNATNGLQLRGSKIAVAVYDPATPGRTKEAAKMAFVPRKVVLKKAPAKTSSIADSSTAGTSSDDRQPTKADEADPTAVPKSNADFRKMLGL